MPTILQVIAGLVAVVVATLVALLGKYWHYTGKFLRLLRMKLMLDAHLKLHAGKPWSFADFYEGMVDKAPHAVQLILAETGEQRTRKEVDDLANQVAAWAIEEGCTQGETAALFLTNRLSFPSIWLGLGKVGVATALLNTQACGIPFMHAVRTALASSRIKLLILDSDFRDKLAAEVAKLTAEGVRVAYWGEGDDCVNAHVQSLPTDRPSAGLRSGTLEGSPLVYIFTSGTTGLPKACRISQTRYLMGGHFLPTTCGVTERDVLYCPLPLYHSAGGLLGLGGAFAHGYTMVMRKRFSASAFAPEAARYKVTAVQYIGELARYMSAAPAHPQDQQLTVRVAFGNGMRADYWQAFQQRYRIPEVVEFYAATEGNVALINNFGRVGALGFIPRILDFVYPIVIVKVEEEGSAVPLRDAQGRCVLCAADEPGLMLSVVTATRQFDGYTDAAATAQKVLRDVFRKGDAYFNTGDLLSRDRDGFFFWCDRVGDTFRWKGENVSASEVHDILAPCALVDDAVVYGVAVPGADGKAGMAAIVPKASEPDEVCQQIAAACAANLPAYARPLFLRLKPVGAKLPVTVTFKYIKADLVREGMDPSKAQAEGDRLLYWDSKAAAYAPLTDQVYAAITSGSMRF